MEWSRASGLLAHPTSLPGRFGIGDIGPGARRLLDFLAAAGQRLWQVLPLGPTGYGDSPYAALSAFAGNPMLISPELLSDDGLLDHDDLEPIPPFDPAHVDYGSVLPWKTDVLRRAHQRFLERGSQALRDEFAAFETAEAAWLDNFALFMALKDDHGGAPWTDWQPGYAAREAAALDEARARLAGAVAFHRFAQFLFFRQWRALRQEARARGISLIGDAAIFVAHDSADVWVHRDLFALDEHGMPTVVAGVPPDYFSSTGQRWGNPLYRWDVLAEQGYSWWVERIRHALEFEDIIRLDHFRGFAGYWEIPAWSPTAVEGRWVDGPGEALFAAIRAALGDVPIIAEDLGLITPDVVALRRTLGLPGMHVLQFAFGGDAQNGNLPHNYERDAVVYTGTHDNDTTRGWFDAADEHTREHVLRYLDCQPEGAVAALMRAALASVATMAVIPLQDVLGLGSEARMNFPSRAEQNWAWRCTADQLTDERAAALATLTQLYGR